MPVATVDVNFDASISPDDVMSPLESAVTALLASTVPSVVTSR